MPRCLIVHRTPDQTYIWSRYSYPPHDGPGAQRAPQEWWNAALAHALIYRTAQAAQEAAQRLGPHVQVVEATPPILAAIAAEKKALRLHPSDKQRRVAAPRSRPVLPTSGRNTSEGQTRDSRRRAYEADRARRLRAERRAQA